ncbi:hypothetical protein H2200_002906 [Cladophialophora chaetospira]|uniref:YCII-related domain-containing protein n=1 Tax=Cladophialophora chaetospira TaxID=386627 RepID=A0AA39CLS9_9EURO|nr:hypothetical protein H2200_002906 [Cladophialophora chaetospira]
MTQALQEYLVVIPDVENVSPEVRAEARPIHLQDIQPEIDAGAVVMGGALLSKMSQPGQPPAVNGSVLLVHMENDAAVRRRLENDIYTKKGVWDVSKAQVIQIKCGFRKPM